MELTDLFANCCQRLSRAVGRALSLGAATDGPQPRNLCGWGPTSTAIKSDGGARAVREARDIPRRVGGR
eukprot:scaffold7240_cov38-Prasinocladus_malaysianus.AAC.2